MRSRPPKPTASPIALAVFGVAASVGCFALATQLDAEPPPSRLEVAGIVQTREQATTPQPSATRRDQTIQSVLDESWPELGEHYRREPTVIDNLALEACYTLGKVTRPEAVALYLTMSWADLDGDTKTTLDDDVALYGSLLKDLVEIACPQERDQLEYLVD